MPFRTTWAAKMSKYMSDRDCSILDFSSFYNMTFVNHSTSQKVFWDFPASYWQYPRRTDLVTRKKRNLKPIVKSQNNFMLISSCTSYFNKIFNTVGRMTPLRSGVWTSRNLKGADFCQVLLDVL